MAAALFVPAGQGERPTRAGPIGIRSPGAHRSRLKSEATLVDGVPGAVSDAGSTPAASTIRSSLNSSEFNELRMASHHSVQLHTGIVSS